MQNILLKEATKDDYNYLIRAEGYKDSYFKDVNQTGFQNNRSIMLDICKRMYGQIPSTVENKGDGKICINMPILKEFERIKCTVQGFCCEWYYLFRDKY